MAKRFSLILRILLAAIGVMYIVWSLTWTDQLIVPAGLTLPDGRVLQEPKAFPFVQQTTADGSDKYILQIDPNVQPPVTFTVPESQLGEGKHDYRLQLGILTSLRGSHVGLLVAAFILTGLCYPLQAFRWWIMMRCRGIVMSYARALRLMMVGVFFDFCLPGTTGGDVAKAYYTAKGSDRRTDAVMSIVFDRLTGMLGLVALAALAGLFILNDEVGRRITLYIWPGALVIGIMVKCYFSQSMRRWIGLEWWIRKLPFSNLMQSIDAAAVAYGHHQITVRSAIAMSMFVHVMLATATAMSGYALGMSTSYGVLLTVVPVIYMAGAVPLTYQGLGVMEGLGIAFLLNPDTATTNHIVGMFLLMRLYRVAFGLLGSTFLLGGEIHMHPGKQSSLGD